MRGAAGAATVAGVAACLCFVSPLAADEAAWGALERAREELAAAPLAAEFVQTYVPAGFSSGDEESGRLYLSLPSCLRWDYEEPYPRSYLLCAQTVWAWSPEEPVGDRYLSVSREEAGLDFLLLSVDRLRLRYAASLGGPDGASPGGADTEGADAGDADTGDTIRIDLTSLTEEAPFARARITLAGDSRRPVRLEYTDREGNHTRFDLTSFTELADGSVFLPPDDIEWIDG